ncbi:MAG TPA: ABC transporter permease [Gammaproteobacteria bacterium]|nr:ABC transporter permease [Gammaproteobacteria bacterium]
MHAITDVDTEVELKGRSSLGEFWLTFRKDRLALVGFAVLVVLAILALAGKAFTEWWVLFDPAAVRLSDRLLPPFTQASPVLSAGERPAFDIYLLGTDELGRDVFARMLQGSFVSLSIGFVAVGIAMSIGVALGGISGYYGETKILGLSIDNLTMRFTDVMLCFPTFFLILTVVALLPPSIYNIMIVIGVTGWMTTARFVRAEFLSLKEQDFVLAAKAMGLPERRIIFFHMLPNALAPVLVTATVSVATAILTESALSFLGFGVQPPDATWGNILSDGKNFIFDAPWLFFIPGSAILVVVLAFNLVGEGMRESLNPKLRRR